MKLTDTQIDLINHALGISQGQSMPFRNYYCSGRSIDSDWEDLITKGFAYRRTFSSLVGGIFYYISRKGFQFILENKASFIFLDQRMKKLETLINRANE